MHGECHAEYSVVGGGRPLADQDSRVGIGVIPDVVLAVHAEGAGPFRRIGHAIGVEIHVFHVRDEVLPGVRKVSIEHAVLEVPLGGRSGLVAPVCGFTWVWRVHLVVEGVRAVVGVDAAVGANDHSVVRVVSP